MKAMSRIIYFFNAWFMSRLFKTYCSKLKMKNYQYLFMMKKLIVLPLVFLSLFTFAQTTYEIPENVKRIAFLGNSITYSGGYISYLEAYYTLKYPNRKLEFINVGLPSETVSKLSEPNHADGKFPRPKLQDRLKKTLKKLNPDLIFSCYGMNDGIYLPFDDARFEKFKKGILWLDKRVKKEGIPIIHLTPSVYDKDGGEAYANVLDIYADWLLSLQYTNNSNVIDIHWPLRRKIEDILLINPYYEFAPDGIHPRKQGHWLMANQLLIALGELNRLETEDTKCFKSFRNGKEVLALVEQKQQLLKNGWLTYIGHKRPNMKKGLSLTEVETQVKIIDAKIKVLLEE